jgi:hypothetical protein
MSQCMPECDCMVCRNRRHREAVWARHNAGQDYLGIHARITARINEPRDPNWKADRPPTPNHVREE